MVALEHSTKVQWQDCPRCQLLRECGRSVQTVMDAHAFWTAYDKALEEKKTEQLQG